VPVPFWRKLFWSGFHVPLLAIALLMGNAALLQIPLSKPLIVLEASGVWMVYLLDRSPGVGFEDRVNRPERMAWWWAHRMLQRGGLPLGAPLAGGVALQLRPITLAPGADLWLLASYRLLWLLPNPLLANWPDRVGDRDAGVRTPAVRWSYGTLRRVALGLLLGALNLDLVLVVRLNRPVAAVDLLSVVLTGMVIGAARRAITDEHRVLLDLLVAWPAVTAWVLG